MTRPPSPHAADQVPPAGPTLVDPTAIQEAPDSADRPFMRAVAIDGDAVRNTTPDHDSQGRLLGAMRGLLSARTDDGVWIVPAIHAIWMPPDCAHSLRPHGPFAGWSVYIAVAACATLPAAPCTLRASGLLREAVERAVGWDDGPLDEAQTRIAHVVLDEIRALPRECFGLPMPQDARLLRIARALVDTPADGRTLDEWAAWAGIAPRTLTRRFTTETGYSFTEWRLRIRVLHALEMLASGESVTAIAVESGYDNVSAFIAMFRRTFGVTPSRYFQSLTKA